MNNHPDLQADSAVTDLVWGNHTCTHRNRRGLEVDSLLSSSTVSSRRQRRRRLRHCAVLLLALLCGSLTGCVTQRLPTYSQPRPFDFQTDTFAYANQLVWEYHFDEATGKRSVNRREPPPTYSHHCFVVVRAAKQFFCHARFDPALPKADQRTYRNLIRKVVSSSPRSVMPEAQRIVIPGYANLKTFSRDWEELLKQQCGGAWESYFQRGHWRMIFPFSRGNQAAEAESLLCELQANQALIVHVVQFPSLGINHSVLLFNGSESDNEIRFGVYDPNEPDQPGVLTYRKTDRTFSYPRNFYFWGGDVDVYEVYRSWWF